MKQKLTLLLLTALLALSCGCAASFGGETAAPESAAAATEVTETAPVVTTAAPETETPEPTDTPEPSESIAPEESIAPSESIAPEESASAETAAPSSTGADSGTTSTDSGANAFDVTWNVIQEYGFNSDDYSRLSFTLDETTLQDCGDYYSMEATLGKGIYVDTSLTVGETFTITINELTGETRTLTVTGNQSYTDEWGCEYYLAELDVDSNGNAALCQGSDDRVDDTFYTGVVHISKTATWGIAITGEYRQLEESDLTEEYLWFNGVRFDENGVITSLVFFGD